MVRLDPHKLYIELNESTRLVPVDPSMANEIFSLIDSNREMLGEWLPWVLQTKQPSDTEDALKRFSEGLKSEDSFNLAIIHEEKPVGMIGVHELDWSNKKATVGYWLAREGQGRGLMTLACKALTALLIDDLNINRVEIRCSTDNKKSRAIPEKLGFVHEATIMQDALLNGDFHNSEVYRMLAAEWIS